MKIKKQRLWFGSYHFCSNSIVFNRPKLTYLGVVIETLLDVNSVFTDEEDWLYLNPVWICCAKCFSDNRLFVMNT